MCITCALTSRHLDLTTRCACLHFGGSPFSDKWGCSYAWVNEGNHPSTARRGCGYSRGYSTLSKSGTVATHTLCLGPTGYAGRREQSGSSSVYSVTFAVVSNTARISTGWGRVLLKALELHLHHLVCPLYQCSSRAHFRQRNSYVSWAPTPKLKNLLCHLLCLVVAQ